MRKPPLISHYLLLRDLLAGVDVRQKDERGDYLTSRLSNIKLDLKSEGIEFEEGVTHKSKYSHYKEYKLQNTPSNMQRAEEVLKKYETKAVKDFLACSA